MVEIALPANSRVKKGVTHTAEGTIKKPRTLKVYRWNPDDAENPRVDSYVIDEEDCGPMVLDALLKVKNELDSTLTFSAVVPRRYLRLLRHEY